MDVGVVRGGTSREESRKEHEVSGHRTGAASRLDRELRNERGLNGTHPLRPVPSNLAREVEDVVVGFLACWRIENRRNGRYVECGCRSDGVEMAEL